MSIDISALEDLLRSTRHFTLDPGGKRLRVSRQDSFRVGVLGLFAITCFGLLMGLASRFGPASLGMEGLVGDDLGVVLAVLGSLLLAFLAFYRSYFEVDLSCPGQWRMDRVQLLGDKSIRNLSCCRHEVRCLTHVEVYHRGRKMSWRESQLVLELNDGNRVIVVGGAETMNKGELYQNLAASLAAILGVPRVLRGDS